MDSSSVGVYQNPKEDMYSASESKRARYNVFVGIDGLWSNPYV